MSPEPRSLPKIGAPPLLERYREVRATTERIVAPLSPEDATVQSMPDASPAKWHLAHTSWFFETFVLESAALDYRPFHPRFRVLFNSYYNTVGDQHPRPERGLVSRPSLAEIRDYRAHVDDRVARLIERGALSEELAAVVDLGLHHEQQHEELALTDLKHMLAQNPLRPTYRDLPVPPAADPGPLRWYSQPGGIASIGFEGDSFSFDNERPRHRVLLEPFALASRAVTNGEYLEFIRAGGYTESSLWLSDGWAKVNSEGWRRPLYWSEDLNAHYTLGGQRDIDPAAPVCHVSYYEADAFARWAEARLPTEAELEHAAAAQPVAGNFLESGLLQPAAARGSGLTQLYGDVWEWTSSAYGPYPGFRPLRGSLGEYNGKFMCSQLVLRGGSCTTPTLHMRSTYRNFFYPDARWQYSGIRLARDQ